MSNERNRVVAGELSGCELSQVKEAVCVSVEKVYDSCKDKDCVEDADVLFRDTREIRWLLKRAINVKARKAEICDIYIDIEPLPFKRGFFTVDVKFFIKVTLDFFIPDGPGFCGTKIKTKKGLVVFDKKVILFGSEGGIKVFRAHFVDDGIDNQTRMQQDNLPVAKVEVAEPIALSARIVERHDRRDCCCADSVLRNAAAVLGEERDEEHESVLGSSERDRSRDHDDDCGRDDDESEKRVLASIGLFSIIKLTRLIQLLIPAFDFCVPSKRCVSATEENACELFETIDFPVDEFFPPQKFEFPGAVESERREHERGEGERREHERGENERRR